MRAHPGGGGMASHLEALAGVGDLGPVDLEDRKVLVEIISHQQIAAVRREHRRLGQAADVELLDLGQLLAVDAQHRDVALVAMEERRLVVGAGEDRGDRDVALGTDREPLGPSPTTTLSITRGGLSSRSITLTVSTLPSDHHLPSGGAPSMATSQLAASFAQCILF